MTHPAQLRQRASDLRRKGGSLNEIASRLGIAKSTASVWLKNTRLSPVAKRAIQQKRKANQFQSGNTHWKKTDRSKSKYFTTWTPEKIRQVRRLYRSGLSMKQVGQRMNLSLLQLNIS